jgi:hypothetical protein
MDLLSSAGQKAMAKLREGIKSLTTSELLERKRTFDLLPPPSDTEAALRDFEGLALEAALLSEFGLKWHKTVEAYKKKTKTKNSLRKHT